MDIVVCGFRQKRQTTSILPAIKAMRTASVYGNIQGVMMDLMTAKNICQDLAEGKKLAKIEMTAVPNDAVINLIDADLIVKTTSGLRVTASTIQKIERMIGVERYLENKQKNDLGQQYIDGDFSINGSRRPEKVTDEGKLPRSKIVLGENEIVVIEIEGADGRFVINYDQKNGQLRVEANMPDTDGRSGVIYCDHF